MGRSLDSHLASNLIQSLALFHRPVCMSRLRLWCSILLHRFTCTIIRHPGSHAAFLNKFPQIHPVPLSTRLQREADRRSVSDQGWDLQTLWWWLWSPWWPVAWVKRRRSPKESTPRSTSSSGETSEMPDESSNSSYWVSASLTAADGEHRNAYCFVDLTHSDADMRFKTKSKANVLLSLLRVHIWFHFI